MQEAALVHVSRQRFMQTKIWCNFVFVMSGGWSDCFPGELHTGRCVDQRDCEGNNQASRHTAAYQ